MKTRIFLNLMILKPRCFINLPLRVLPIPLNIREIFEPDKIPRTGINSNDILDIILEWIELIETIGFLNQK